MMEPKHRENSRDFAYRVIREMIVNMELTPGSKVSETELASLLNLSRTPVREALIDLEKSGVVEVLPQKGTFISYINPLLVEEARFLRLTLEKEIVSLLCEPQYQTELNTLEENISLQEFYLQHQNYEKFLELDNEFHYLFFKITNKIKIYSLMKGLNIHFDRARTLIFKGKPSITTLEEHKKILTAIKKQDKALAKQYMEEHLHILDLESIEQEYKKYSHKTKTLK
ncbi:GntR family transcriptional regulator [Gallibacterium anatis]|nr:GntR family transcriptional regulator [Gallibacterium anatis]OBW97285.1 hypothetical protein QV02_00765 [Gallibacterium anatis]OBW99026.1 hypothetical protein QV03_04405 [Gallibacterium anatis]HJF72873.1 GntR family transcriptional regulator [Gallibacterium anatis]